MKEHIFLDVNDGSCSKNLQIVINKDSQSKVNFGESLVANGVLASTPKGQLELKVNNYSILGKCPTEGFPFVQRQSYPPEYIRDFLHFRPRVSSYCSMLRFRHSATLAFHKYLSDHEYLNIHTPVITGNDCEGAGEVFRVQPNNERLLKQMGKPNISLEDSFFDKKSYLTVSGQLHLEAMAHGLGNVYTLGPTFRAENSKSPVHLSEFYMLEAEKCFVTSIGEINHLLEDMLKSVTTELLNKSEADIKNCRPDKSIDFKWLQKNQFPTITYAEALEILRKNEIKLKSPIREDDGLSKDQELFLTKHFDDSPIFIIDWPTSMKPFYMREKPLNSSLVDGVDLLVPTIGELAGGSLREDNYINLQRKLPTPDLKWYLELRKYGGITTGGFGLGFERYLQFILGVINIKDAIPFPRWAHNCSM